MGSSPIGRAEMRKFFFYLFVILLALVIAIPLYIEIFVESKTPHEVASTETRFTILPHGDEIAYQEIDNKAPVTVIFVGGLSGWSGTWKRVMKVLNTGVREKYNFLALDLPPFGYSTVTKSEEGTFFRDQGAERINQFREAKKLDRVIFVGHSYGAGIVTEAVMRNPLGVEKLVIIDGVLNIEEPKLVKRNFITNYPGLIKILVPPFSHSTLVVQNRLKSFVHNTTHITPELADLYSQSFSLEGTNEKLSWWIRDYILDPLNYKSTDSTEYKKLSMPVRVIWGKEDILTPLHLTDILMDNLQNGKLLILENVGHIPMIEDYEQFDAALLESFN